MALIKCPECGKEVSDKAETCPNCGYKVSKDEFQNNGVMFNTNSSDYSTEKKNKKEADKLGSISAIIALLALFLSITKYIGLLLGIAGFAIAYKAKKKDKKAKNSLAAIAASILAICISFLLIVAGSTDTNIADNTTTQENENIQIQEEATVEPTEKPTEKPKTAKQIKKEYMSSCKEYSYKDVLRNPDDYIGEKVKIQLKISSVHEKDILNDTKYYLAYSKGEYGWYENMYAVFDKRSSEDLKLLEDDIIEVYGEIAEPEDTVSLIVNSSEVFAINMKYVKLIDE